MWSGFLEALLFPIAVIWAGGATYARAPRLTTAAMILAVPGYLCLAWLVAGSDAIIWYGATHGLDQDLVTNMAWGVHPAFLAALGTFVIGHTLGMLLLGMAAIRSRAIPLSGRGRLGGEPADPLRRRRLCQRPNDRSGHEYGFRHPHGARVGPPRPGDLPQALSWVTTGSADHWRPGRERQSRLDATSPATSSPPSSATRSRIEVIPTPGTQGPRRPSSRTESTSASPSTESFRSAVVVPLCRAELAVASTAIR